MPGGVGPALLGRHQIGIFFGGRPGDKGLGRVRLEDCRDGRLRPQPVAVTPSLLGAWRRPTGKSATVRLAGSVPKLAATVASIQMPHLPCWNSDRFSLNPFGEAPGGPYSVIMVRWSSSAAFHSGLSTAVSVHVEPARAMAVGHGRWEGHVLAQPGLPRRQMPCSLLLSVIALAAFLIWAQVGFRAS